MEQRIIDNIKELVIDCGKLLLDANYDELGIENKEGNHNLVTKYDVLIQKKLKKELLEIVPNANFIGEEGDFLKDNEKEYTFIVDPIDGTINFSRDLKMSAISVALLKDGEVIVGICYNPFIDEMYEAQRGKGAYLNGKRIHVSDRKIEDGIILCGCAPYYNELRQASLEVQRKMISVASDFRRFGTAVIEICAVASGKAEAFYELKLMPWDHAAASLILTEAGGVVTTTKGEKMQYENPTSIIASNGVDDYLKYFND